MKAHRGEGMETPRYVSVNAAAKARGSSRHTVLGRGSSGARRDTFVDRRIVSLADDVEKATPPKAARRTA